jgi:hypothetical protein
MQFHNKNRNDATTVRAAVIIFTLALIFMSTSSPTTATMATSNTIATTTTTTSPSSGLELSPQPVWDEVVVNTDATPINETHTIVTFIGNGTMTVPNTGQTINMTNNGYGIISPIPGDPSTISAYGREAVYSEDGDSSAITFHEIVRYEPETPQGKGVIIAVFDRNATSMLAPFNGMIVTGIHEEPPNAGVAIIKLWEWKGGIPLSSGNTAASSNG